MPVAALRRGWIVLLCGFALAAGARGDETLSLHERVDALVDADAVGPLNPPTSDGDFLRRVSLDLAGIIPTADEARAFLADESPNKREALIDRLLTSPQYARQMSLTFDVVLMERRGDKAIKTPEWQAYLRHSFAANKPLDQLFHELVAGDGSDEALRPAARFLLDRDCEPNVVTRDLGRMLFGMDLQCAQCHDHPLVADYFQSDYYGLFAFVHRSSVFTDAKKKQTIGEKADGEANYKSVFTGDSADRVIPRLPKGAVLAEEPTFAKGTEYVSAPAKDVRGIPKFSRRAQLAAMLKESHEFRRNLANRLWAHLFGRGLVHPVDYHHAANPPSHPELLALLADELAGSNFDAKAMLRELALTRAYQRSCDAPESESMSLPPVAEETTRLEGQRPALAAKIDEAKVRLDAVAAERKTLQEEFARKKTEIAALESALKTAQETAAKAAAEQKTADEELVKKKNQAQAVADAATKAKEAIKELPQDKELAAAAELFESRTKSLAAEVESATKAAGELAAKAKSAAELVAAPADVYAKATTDLPADKLAALGHSQLDLTRHLADTRFAVAALEGRIATAQAVGEYAEKRSDPAAAEPALAGLVDRWTVANQIGPLKPLTCEQFALSLMQATGMVAPQIAAAQAAIEKSPPDALKNAADADRPRLMADLVEVKAFEQLRGNLNAFVGLYGTDPGADFQATVNQALFFGNGSVVTTWLNPSGENLAARLVKIEDQAALADELYLSVLTRFPTEDEWSGVAEYLKDRGSDRPAAMAELIWALASSNEFRFNH